MRIFSTHFKQIVTAFAILSLQTVGWAQTIKTVHLSSNTDYDCSTYFDSGFVRDAGYTPPSIKGIKTFISSLQYPSEYKKYKISGKVFVYFLIDKTGEVICYKIESGLPEPFINETEKMLSKLSFKPASLGPKSVIGDFVFPLTWEPEEKASRKRRKR
ncbi:energy transducer TonB [Telluribacter sp. SYSU D00476]|uniref:energy transducer TonB n=1 Tax=Telluribacter sp. SYSU D00476 TaxID=2811430 RepID=UPI001FF3498F|nr:energy transducer TonB [Telluribacter sp. SYSU D00476]